MDKQRSPDLKTQVEVTLVRPQPREWPLVWAQWGVQLNEAMAMLPCTSGSIAAESHQARGCVGLTLVAVDDVPVDTVEQTTVLMRDMEAVVLHFRVAPVVDEQHCQEWGTE